MSAQGAGGLRRLKPDPFTLLMLSTVTLATVLPARGWARPAFNDLTTFVIALLFFLHGAKLSREAIMAGIGAWRLHLTVFASTFVLFPLSGLAVKAGSTGWLNPGVASGILFLSLLPSTVQSSIAFTSIAGGNVPAAVCSASASNLIGIFLTPVLAATLMGAHGRSGNTLAAMQSVALQLLVPFLIGHLLRPLIGRWVDRRKAVLGLVDRSSILLVVYSAFSAAVVEGLWRRLSLGDLALTLGVDALVLAMALLATTYGARALGFGRRDEIAIVFCGSKKSLASGVPMASVLFPVAQVGVMIVPLMLFHQIQLMVCAVLAKRYAARDPAKPSSPVAVQAG